MYIVYGPSLLKIIMEVFGVLQNSAHVPAKSLDCRVILLRTCGLISMRKRKPTFATFTHFNVIMRHITIQYTEQVAVLRI